MSSWALICDAMRIRSASLESVGLENFDGEMQALHRKGPCSQRGIRVYMGEIYVNGWDVGTVKQVKRAVFNEGQGKA